MLGIIITDRNKEQLFLSYQWIVENSNISINSVENWSKRKIGVYIKEDGYTYIDYDSIPKQSQQKLPTKEQLRDIHSEYYKRLPYYLQKDENYNVLSTAYNVEFPQYRETYLDLGFSGEKATEYARNHAVWTRIIELHTDGHKLRPLHDAYKMVYPDGYVYNSMNPNINKCKESGIVSLLVKDARSNENSKKFDARYEAFVIRWMSSGKKYSRVTIFDELCKECKQLGWEKPSYSWVKLCVARNMNHTKRGRYGEMDYFSKDESYAGIIKALYPHDQWQIDGWDLPFHMEGWRKLTLFAVMDASSGYIIGYDIAPTENTETILRGLERAVKAAKCLPYEIVSDNHSFNKTKEAEYLKINTDKLGMTWTVSSNPRRKGVIERRLGVLGTKFLKKYPGYIGEGIKTKNIDGRTSIEEMSKYQKPGMWRTADEIKRYAIESIIEYNNYVSQRNKVSPSDLYFREEQPNKIELKPEDYTRLFIREAEYKVQRGQINITREGVTYEFQLNAEMQTEYNTKTLKVRYESFDEIYIFDQITDKFIGTVKSKRMMHGALANQSEADKRGFLQNSGRVKGVKTKYSKMQSSILDEAENIDKYASECINPLVCKKEDIKEIERKGLLNAELLNHNVDIKNITPSIILNEDNTIKREPKAKTIKVSTTIGLVPRNNNAETGIKKNREQPFTDPSHKISIVPRTQK